MSYQPTLPTNVVPLVPHSTATAADCSATTRRARFAWEKSWG